MRSSSPHKFLIRAWKPHVWNALLDQEFVSALRTNRWSPGRQTYRWSPRSCKERQGKPPSTNSNRDVPQDRRWRTSSARPCGNPSILVARESPYYHVAAVAAAPCTSWDSNSTNARWLIAGVSGRGCATWPIIFRYCSRCGVKSIGRTEAATRGGKDSRALSAAYTS